MNMLPITVADSGSSSATGLGGQTVITGTPTPGSFVSVKARGTDSFIAQALGAFTATLVAEASFDGGTTWYLVTVLPSGESTPIASMTVAGSALIAAAGAANVRVRCTSFSSGPLSVGIENACVSLAGILDSAPVNPPVLATRITSDGSTRLTSDGSTRVTSNAASGFTPSTVSLVDWWRSDQNWFGDAPGTVPATTNGQNILAWTGSVNGVVMNNSSGTRIPTWQKNSLGAGLSSVHLNSQFLSTPNALGGLGPLNQANCSTFIVVRWFVRNSALAVNLFTTPGTTTPTTIWLNQGYSRATVINPGSSKNANVGYPFNTFGVIGVTSNSSGYTFWVNGVPSLIPTTALSTTSVGSIGIGWSAAAGSASDIAEMLHYNRALTPTEVAALTSFLMTRFSITVPAPVYNMVFSGDSITDGYVSAFQPFWDVGGLAAGLVESDMHVFGYPGATTAGCITSDTALGASVFHNSSLPANRNISSLLEVTNYFASSSAATLAQAQTDYMAWCALHSSFGNKVIANTVLDRSGLFSGGQTVGNFNTLQQGFNAWLRTNYASFADALADPASDANLGAVGASASGTYFSGDGTHPNQTGHTLMGSYYPTPILSF